MKYISFLVVLFFIFGNIACSSNEGISNKIEVETKAEKIEAKSLSLDDQVIIQKYKDKINSLDFSDKQLRYKTMRDNLSEISKIKNDDEREKLQLNIYFALEMYKEAYELNSKILKRSFSNARLVSQCDLTYYAKRSKDEYKECHTKLASAFKKELKKTPKTEPEYIYVEWGYLLSMYKSGHKEYKQKLKEMFEAVDNDQIRLQFEGSYVLAVEQVESYKKLSHD